MTTIIGMVFGFACVIISILWAGASVNDYVDLPSIFCVVGGVIGATVMCYPISTLKTTISVITMAFKTKNFDYVAEIESIIEICIFARKEGFLQLEERVADIDDPFFRKGVELLVDGSPAELVQSIMETDMAFMQERHSSTQAVLLQMSSFAPAFGMIGTLIGLINMLGSLDDMASLGPNMAVALVTTFYGVVLANLVFTPLAKKLKSMSDDEYLRKEIQLEGMLSILNGENPTIIRIKLNSFLSNRLLALAKGKDAESDSDEDR